MNVCAVILSLIACATIGGHHVNLFVTATSSSSVEGGNDEIQMNRYTRGLSNYNVPCVTDDDCRLACPRFRLFGCPSERKCINSFCRNTNVYEKCGSRNVCNKQKGQVCCDQTCGVCGTKMKDGRVICPKMPCILPPTRPPPNDDDETCGPKNTICGSGEYCCNPSCGICAPLGGACTKQFCDP